MEETMGQRIYNLRKKNGLTLEELGNRVGVGKSTVRKWENGMIANMGRDKIAKLAEVFNVSPAWLMGYEEEQKPLDGVDRLALDIISNPTLYALFELARDAKSEDLKLTTEFLKRMKGE